MAIKVGEVEALFRYPVKSMGGEALQEAELGWHGLDGDRRLGLRRMADRSGFPWLTATKLPELILFAPVRTDDESLPTTRCLALSAGGSVYDGDVTVLDGGALRLDVTGYEGDQVVLHVARFDFEPDGSLRERVWSLNGNEGNEGAERTLRLDVHHAKVETKEG